MKYKGIELEGLDKKVKLSHSRVMETDEGDKAALTPTQFHEVSALSSVINMDYQICNGGISQYVFNGYHEDCAPYSDDDVAHLGQSGQVAMLRELASFGDEAFPGKSVDWFLWLKYTTPFAFFGTITDTSTSRVVLGSAANSSKSIIPAL